MRGELERILSGPSDGQRLGGIGSVRFFVRCEGNADQVLRKSKEVLRLVLEHSEGSWPSHVEWQRILPIWFVEACADEVTHEEAERELARLQKLTPAKRAQEDVQARWALSAWLYWFESKERQWEWWDAAVGDSDTIRLAVQVDGWPFPWGDLRWLFRASGASQVDAEE